MPAGEPGLILPINVCSLKQGWDVCVCIHIAVRAQEHVVVLGPCIRWLSWKNLCCATPISHLNPTFHLKSDEAHFTGTGGG